jgi:hypothetical protein
MKNKILTYGIWVVLIGLLAGICIAIYMFNKPKRDISNTKPEYTVSAEQLLTEFTKNEQAANAKYLSASGGKVIQVSGIIAEIEQKGDTTLNISLKGPSDSQRINCSMEKTEIQEAKSLKIGNKVSMKGECTGYLDITSEVSMVNCVYEK